MSTLRRLGLGRRAAVEILHEELEHLVRALDAECATRAGRAEPLDAHSALVRAAANSVCGFVFGVRLADEDRAWVERFVQLIGWYNRHMAARGRAFQALAPYALLSLHSAPLDSTVLCSAPELAHSTALHSTAQQLHFWRIVRCFLDAFRSPLVLLVVVVAL